MPSTPTDLLSCLEAIEKQITIIKEIAEKEDVYRKFTLDGRFVGDVGELVAKRFFSLNLHVGQKPYHDAEFKLGDHTGTIQIKARRACDAVDLSKSDKREGIDRLLVLEFSDDWKTWSVVYNGPWPEMKSDSQRFSLRALAALQSKICNSQQISLRD